MNDTIEVQLDVKYPDEPWNNSLITFSVDTWEEGETEAKSEARLYHKLGCKVGWAVTDGVKCLAGLFE